MMSKPLSTSKRAARHRGSLPACLVGVLAAAAVTGTAAAAEPAPLLTGAELSLLVARGLVTRDPARVRHVLGPFAARASAEGVDLDAVFLAGANAMECVLGRAVARRATMMAVFTDELFLSQRHTAILIDRAALGDLGRAFDFHTAFPISGRLRDGNVATMQFVLVGQGRLIIGYDHGGTFDHPDPEYGVRILLKTLRGYELGRFVRMEIARDGDGRRVLRNLQIADGPADALAPFRGPGNFAVRQLVVDGPHMKVITALKNVVIDPSPVTARGGAADRPARLAVRGCPVTGSWPPRAP